MIVYLDTSAALRVLVAGLGRDAAAITRRTQTYLDELVDGGHTIVSATLLRTEMRCQANRQPEIDPAQVEEFTALVNLVELDATDLEDAPTIPGKLRTLDAIHLAVALRVGADLLVAYDEDLCRAAQSAGLRTCPG